MAGGLIEFVYKGFLLTIYLTRLLYNICTHLSNFKYIFATNNFLVLSERALLMNLYEKIKELAAKKNISIRQLEEKLQLANGTIRRWGKTNPSTSAVTKVADYFNVSIDYLLGREEAKPVSEPIDLAEVANSDDDAIFDSILSAGGRPLTDKDKAMIKLVFADRWEELQQKAKDLKDSEK